MNQRRHHKKSRHGCSNCKKNKLKCDEQKPSCGRCVRTGQSCSLLNPTSALLVIDSSRPKSNNNKHRVESESSQNVAEVVSNGGNQLNKPVSVEDLAVKSSSLDPDLDSHFSSTERDHLRLLTHYTISTCKTIADITLANEEGLSLWREYIPQLAIDNDFLLHGLLGLSSLHLALTGPSPQQRNISLAIQHHDRGLSLFRPNLLEMTPEKTEALFAFAGTVALHSFGIHRAVESVLSPLARIIETLTLIRGTSVIVICGFDLLQQGPLGKMMYLGPKDGNISLPDDIEAVMEKLAACIQTTVSARTQSDVYQGAIDALRRNFWFATVDKRSQKAITFFPLMVPADFFVMVRVGEPLALAILANYAVIILWMRNNIWLEGWGEYTIQAVQQALPRDWYDCIDWAVSNVTAQCAGLQEIWYTRGSVS